MPSKEKGKYPKSADELMREAHALLQVYNAKFAATKASKSANAAANATHLH
jgi:hypothetical protein